MATGYVMIKDLADGSATDIKSVPLKELHLFTMLPSELRIKIWHFAMKQRRLIEIESGPDYSIPTGFGNGTHHWCRVCPRSRQPPVLMHVCHESREEAEKVYKLRCFDSKISPYLPYDPPEYWIWFNPKSDILYFGENTCVSTVVEICSWYKKDIPAIAIVCSGKGEECCDHDDPTYGVDGGVGTLQALHGVDPSRTLHNYRYGGCPGPKEVFIVVKSKLWPRGQGEIDDTVDLRPATNDGLTRGQVPLKESLTREIARVDAEMTMPGVGPNLWTGYDQPHFQFVSFAPIARGFDPRMRDGMTVSRRFKRKSWAMTTDASSWRV